MTKATVNAGACGFTAVIHAERQDRRNVTIRIESDCKEVQKMAEQISTLHLKEVLKHPLTEHAVYVAAGSARVHAGCPIPCAVVKAAEICMELALPKPAEIQFSTAS